MAERLRNHVWFILHFTHLYLAVLHEYAYIICSLSRTVPGDGRHRVSCERRLWKAEPCVCKAQGGYGKAGAAELQLGGR